MLYHATSPLIAEKIVRDNFDWRMTFRSRFGVGVCFSPEPKYAHEYASSRGGIQSPFFLTFNISILCNWFSYNFSFHNFQSSCEEHRKCRYQLWLRDTVKYSKWHYIEFFKYSVRKVWWLHFLSKIYCTLLLTLITLIIRFLWTLLIMV